MALTDPVRTDRGVRARPAPPIGVWLVALVLTLTGCGGGGSALAGARESETELVTAMLEAVASEDRVAMRSLVVSREEYESVLWPEMPDKEHAPFDFVWSLNQVNTRKGIRQLLSEFGGMRLEVVSVTFVEEPEVYESFSLHPGAEVVVRRLDTGEEGVLPSFDVLVRHGGRWKLVNVDEL